MLLVACSLCFIILLLGLIYVKFKNQTFQNTPPGSLGLPIIGETLEYLRTQRKNVPWIFYHHRIEKYGPVFKTSLFNAVTVVGCAPEGNRFVFANDQKQLLINSWPSSVRNMLGPNSMILKHGDEYRRFRHVLNAFLKPEALQRYVRRVSNICSLVLSDSCKGKQPFMGFALVKHLTFSIACNLFLSMNSDQEQQTLGEDFLLLVKGMMQLPIYIIGTRYYKGLKARERILQLLDKYISQRKKDLRDGIATQNQDLLSVLLHTSDEQGNLISEDEIKDCIILMLFAGHDTSSSTLAAAIKYLANNPVWLDKVQNEQLEIAAEKSEDEGLTWEDTRKMKWTWRVIQETLRIQPVATGGFREAITSLDFAGFSIPKGWKVHWTVNTCHRNPKFFRDPDKFDPTRFEGEGPAPHTYVPFGGGPRSCPGNEFAKMEILVFFHHLLTKYEWSLVDPQEEFTRSPMPFPKKGLQMLIKTRNE